MTENELILKLRTIAGSCTADPGTRVGGQAAEAGEPDGPVIFLTFDDGPGPHTARLLDILKDCGVRATFFVTAQRPDCLDLIGRAAKEGHSIGAHTCTHDYREIYAGEAAFFTDFLKCQELIRSQTGRYTDLFRFPGGSSNTVSRISPGIMTRLAETMSGMGFCYFDWNVDSGDASGLTDGQAILRNIIEGCRDKETSVVLQHDIKAFSVDIVRQVILWGREQGYSFRPLDRNSSPVRHLIAN